MCLTRYVMIFDVWHVFENSTNSRVIVFSIERALCIVDRSGNTYGISRTSDYVAMKLLERPVQLQAEFEYSTHDLVHHASDEQVFSQQPSLILKSLVALLTVATQIKYPLSCDRDHDLGPPSHAMWGLAAQAFD